MSEISRLQGVIVEIRTTLIILEREIVFENQDRYEEREIALKRLAVAESLFRRLNQV